MRAYILCGGQGTRLRSIIRDGQKALVDIDGQPFLALVLAQLKQAGIERVILCAGHRAELVADALPGLAAGSGLPLELVVETAALGTGGALLHALQRHPPATRYLVLNADTFVDSQAYRRLRETPGNAMLAVRVAERERFGSLACTEDGLVHELREKTASGPGLINGGVYAFAPDTLSGWPLLPCSLERDILPPLLRCGPFRAVEYAGPFRDIGTPESLAAFKLEIQA